jgi:uncharacterized protein involved in exopolysaccharide biosynthesis
MEEVRRQRQKLERLEVDIRYLRGMWNSPLTVAQQQVRLLARAGYRLVPGASDPLRPSWRRRAAVGLAGGTALFLAGLLVGWALPDAPP